MVGRETKVKGTDMWRVKRREKEREADKERK